MNVVFATDERYAQHCLVALTSLVEHNEDVLCFIITARLPKEIISIFEQCSTKYGFVLKWVTISETFVSNFPLPPNKDLSHISLAAYYRLFLAELLPQNIDKVIYLDCDIIVNDSLSELWNIDTNGRALAVCEPGDIDFAIGNKVYERLDIPRSYNYFNSGVLVFNLKYFRENNIQKILIDFCKKYHNRIVYHDQDVLNGVLFRETIYFGERFNMQRTHANSDNDYAFNNPAIIHFSSTPKPWDYGCRHLFRYYYYDVLSKTPFNSFKPSFLFRNWWMYIFKPFIKSIIKK